MRSVHIRLGYTKTKGINVVQEVHCVQALEQVGLCRVARFQIDLLVFILIYELSYC